MPHFSPRNLSFLAKDPIAGQAVIDKIMNSPEFAAGIKTALLKTREYLLRMAALSKDESFHEEREWRLVLPISTEKTTFENPPRFRVANTTLIPYIAYPFSPDSTAALPLTDLILGPGSHPSARPAAHAFLKSCGVPVEPRESKVPYRPW